MKTIKLIVASVLLSLSALSTTLTWDANPVEDKVTMYVLEHRADKDSEWIRVEVPGTSTQVSIPESAFGRWFRIAAANSLGTGEWSDPVKLPEKLTGLKIVVEITP